MVVSFLRHADAEPDGVRDFDRSLTPKGLEQAAKVGKFILRQGLIPEVIVTSPVVRARQTARIVGQALGGTEPIEGAWLACGMTPASCLRELAAYQNHSSLLVVGHEPDFSETLAALIGLPASEHLSIRKASLTAIDLPRLAAGTGQLQYLLPVWLM